MGSDEQALISALRRREADALAIVFERYANKIYRLAVHVLGDEHQGDDVVQNTFLALIEHIDRFENRSQLGTWLYRVAYNDCLRRIRDQHPTESFDEVADVMPAVFVDWDAMPETVLCNREAVLQMQQAIGTLSPTLRGVFTLRDIEELSIRETAAILDLSESAVKVYLHRARLALRETLAGYYSEIDASHPRHASTAARSTAS